VHNSSQDGSMGMKRSDITIAKVNVTHLAIEVKKIEGRITQTANAPWIRDLSKLCELKKFRNDTAIRLILVSNHTLPNEWITPTGRAGRQDFGAHGVKYRLPRILKAYPDLPSIDGKNVKLIIKKGH